MKALPTPLPEVLLLEPKVIADARGSFFEAWNQRTWRALSGLEVEFVQDNQSLSKRHVLRGIHYQVNLPQGKLVRVTRGAIWDVAVDLRRSSPRFRRWVGYELSEDNHRMLWVPPGFGHGFYTLSDVAAVLYKTSDFYVAEYDRVVRYNDPDLAIDWPLDAVAPIVSDKDATAPALANAELFE